MTTKLFYFFIVILELSLISTFHDVMAAQNSFDPNDVNSLTRRDQHHKCFNIYNCVNEINYADSAILAKDRKAEQTDNIRMISFMGSPTEIGQKWGKLNADVIKNDVQQPV